jgi:hypothetical protein
LRRGQFSMGWQHNSPQSCFLRGSCSLVAARDREVSQAFLKQPRDETEHVAGGELLCLEQCGARGLTGKCSHCVAGSV